jgi:hypothetical protein
MDYLTDPFRSIAEWAVIAYSSYPGVCQGAATVTGLIVLWLASQVIAHHASK